MFKYKVAYILIEIYRYDLMVMSLRFLEEKGSMLIVISPKSLPDLPETGITTIEFLEEPNFDHLGRDVEYHLHLTDVNNIEYLLRVDAHMIYDINVCKYFRDPETSPPQCGTLYPLLE